MKKHVLITALILFMLTAACTREEDSTIPPEDLPRETFEQEQIIPEEPIPKEEPVDPDITYTPSVWSRIDGSTATIPLTKGLYIYFEGTYDGLNDIVKHNKTHQAYENLVAGNCDLIFVTYPSVEEQALLDSDENEYEIIPVVKDAFVFLVNIDNPITDLSMKQLKDIYTGNTTNWKSLGGKDAEIVPYQRPENSGSQTLFLELVMGDTDPMAPLRGYSLALMNDLVDAVGAYDNGKNSIGYSVYYYASQMYGSENVRLLAVDGVTPTHESIISGQYPLETCYYAVLRKDLGQDSEARRLVNFLLSDEGQIVAKKQMYVPLRTVDDGSGLTEEEFTRRRVSSGTGGTEYIGGAPPEDARLSDLFYDGVNYIQYINDFLFNELTFINGIYGGGNETPFMGIDRDCDEFEIRMGSWNSEKRAELVFIERSAFYRQVPVPADMSPYDMAGYNSNEYNKLNVCGKPGMSEYGVYYYIPVFDGADELNAEIESMMEKEFADLAPENSNEPYMEIDDGLFSFKYTKVDGNSFGFCVDINNKKILSGEEFLTRLIKEFTQGAYYYDEEDGFQKFADCKEGQKLMEDFQENPFKYLYMFGISPEIADWEDFETREQYADEFVQKLKRGYTFGAMWHEWDYSYLEIITHDGEIEGFSFFYNSLVESFAMLLESKT